MVVECLLTWLICHDTAAKQLAITTPQMNLTGSGIATIILPSSELLAAYQCTGQCYKP